MKRLLCILLCVGVLFSVGCVRSKQARSAEKSGFLGDYAQLKPGENEEAILRYVDKSADWGKYTKIILDPIAIYAAKDSDIANIDLNDRLALVNYFDASLRKELGKKYIFTQQTGINTMRIRVAITDADSSNRLTDTVSTILPYGMAVSAVRDIATGEGTGVGDVQIEAEFLDSITGKRIAAGVDRRVGGKSLEGSTDEWDDAKHSFDYWANKIKERLKELSKS